MKKLAAMLATSLPSIIRLFVFSLVLATPILAQRNPTFPQPATKDNPRTDPGELRGRNDNITLLERGKDEAQNRQTALAQMNEDFDRIQKVDRNVLSAISTSDVPDYKRISLGLAEIRKRAIRLRSNLVLPTSSKDEKAQKKRDAMDTSQLQPSLLVLNDLITSFVSNPIFTSRDTNVDSPQVARARRDLDGIIEFSEKIRKSAETLNKTPGKPE